MARQDVDAFAEFYDQTRARVYGLVTRVLRDPGYSEETTQDIYLQVWRTADSYNPAAGSPMSWLMTLAHRRAVDRVRSEQAAGQRESRYGAANVEPPSDQVADSVIQSDEHRQVAECLGSLTDTQRGHSPRLLRRPDLRSGVRAAVGQPRDDQIADARCHSRPTQVFGADMTQPIDDLTALATPYALHAMSEVERADIDRRLASAPPDVARAFGDEVRAVRETMAAISAATAVEPPNELRDRVLAEIGRTPAVQAPVIPMKPRAKRWRTAVLAAAAALIVGLGALGVGLALRPHRRPRSRSSPHRMCGPFPATFPAADVRRSSSPATKTRACW